MFSPSGRSGDGLNAKHEWDKVEVEEPCYYNVLQIQVDASLDEIRRAYKILARRYHPDKKNANPQSDGLLSNHDMFSLVGRAYEVLADPTKRAVYDMLNGHQKYSDLTKLKRKDAEEAVALMKVSFDVKRRAELSRGGLVIDDAVYGAREIIETCKMEELVLCPDVVNVTRQLQCAVENSKLVLPAGDAKHAQLMGLYDPAVGREKLLFVRYYFRGKLHQVVVEDTQRLLMPLKSHARLTDMNGESFYNSTPVKKQRKRANARRGGMSSNLSPGELTKHQSPPSLLRAFVRVTGVSMTLFLLYNLKNIDWNKAQRSTDELLTDLRENINMKYPSFLNRQRA